MAATTNTTKMTDWELVCAVLGLQNTISVPRRVDYRARLMCDGFGKLIPSDLDPTDLYPLYDWSHVRDSKPETIKVVAAYLRSKV